MAKIKLKFDGNEIEIDSRDFYLDNKTMGEIIEHLSKVMSKNVAKVPHEDSATEPQISHTLDSLEEAEVFEPEFNEPKLLELDEIQPKLKILEDQQFFDSPRTVSETVSQLRELGWAAKSLDVSKILAKMATSKIISKSSEENRSYYFTRKLLA